MPSSGSGTGTPASGGVGASGIQRDLCRTLVSLERFARVISYSPMLMHQVYIPDDAAGDQRQPLAACSDPVLQYTWQPRGGGQPGRAEIAQAICQAEEMIERELGFSPAPRWYEDLDTRLMRSAAPGHWGGMTPAWSPYHAQLIADSKYVLHGGVEAWSLIDADAAITYSDTDGDAYSETATVSVATTVEDPDQIAVYYPGTSHAPEWEVRPISVSISGGVATIKFARHLAVLPEKLESLDAQAVDGTVDGNFLSTVDVYRHYNDPATMAIVEWSPPICDTDGAVGQIAAQTGALAVLDSRQGIVGFSPGDWNAADNQYDYVCPEWWRTPDRVRLWVRAGFKDDRLARPYNEMTPRLERAVCLFALALMDRPWVTCEQLRNMQSYWREDLARSESTGAQSVSYRIPQRKLENPIGTTRAALFAWDVINELRVGQAVLSV